MGGGRHVQLDTIPDVAQVRVAAAVVVTLAIERPRGVHQRPAGFVQAGLLPAAELRGLENVRTEWRWVCTAFNLHKLLRGVAALCASLEQRTMEGVG